MRTNFVLMIMIILIFISGCKTSNSSDSINNKLDEYTVSNTTDETVQDDFVFRLVSQKEEYKVGEDVLLYGEIEYRGNKEKMMIQHSASAIFFPMEEKVRGYKIGSAANDIGLESTLKKGEPYREEYRKSGGYSPDQDPKDYVNFMRDFLDRDDFPAGYYEVNGIAEFFVGKKQYEIRADVDFKVVE